LSWDFNQFNGTIAGNDFFHPETACFQPDTVKEFATEIQPECVRRDRMGQSIERSRILRGKDHE
jgi:hypothetical protein